MSGWTFALWPQGELRMEDGASISIVEPSDGYDPETMLVIGGWRLCELRTIALSRTEQPGAQ